VIVRQEGESLVIVRQADHAYLSGTLAAAWGLPPWTIPEPYPSVVVGARTHDDAWLAWDEAPGQPPGGWPLSFYEVDRVTTSDLYRRGIDAVSQLDVYAGLMVSLHYSGFFHGHWDWQPFATPERFSDPDGAALRRFVDGELERQVILRAAAGLGQDDELLLAANYKWLQLWDRISLDICRQDPVEEWEIEYPATPAGYEPDAAPITLRFAHRGSGSYVLNPYPLRIAPIHATIPMTRLRLPLPADRGQFLDTWRTTAQDALAVTISAP
jgi:hypothetical protein